MGISVYKKYMTEVFIKEKVERKPGDVWQAHQAGDDPEDPKGGKGAWQAINKDTGNQDSFGDDKESAVAYAKGGDDSAGGDDGKEPTTQTKIAADPFQHGPDGPRSHMANQPDPDYKPKQKYGVNAEPKPEPKPEPKKLSWPDQRDANRKATGNAHLSKDPADMSSEEHDQLEKHLDHHSRMLQHQAMSSYDPNLRNMVAEPSQEEWDELKSARSALKKAKDSGGEEPSGEPEGSSPKEQAKAELEDYNEPDDVAGWLEDHQDKLGKKFTRQLGNMYSDMEDSFMDATQGGNDDAWDDFDEKLENFKKEAGRMMDKHVPEEPSGGAGGMMGALGHRGSQYRTGKELKGEITVNGKKYRPIKESKEKKPIKKHRLQEQYERFFNRMVI